MAFIDLAKGLINWDEKYNQDFKEVHTELANKANITRDRAFPSTTIKDFDNLPNGYCRVNEFLGAMENSPEPRTFNGTVFTYIDGFGLTTQEATSASMRKYVRAGTGIGEMSPWQALGNAEPPHKLALPITPGIQRVNASEYWRNSFGMVTVSFRLKRLDNSIFPLGSNDICMMPEGFHPKSYVVHASGFSLGRYLDMPIVVETNGRLSVVIINNDVTSVCGTFSYYSMIKN